MEKLKVEAVENCGYRVKVWRKKYYDPKIKLLIGICFVTKFLMSIVFLMTLPFLLETKTGKLQLIEIRIQIIKISLYLNCLASFEA